MELYGVWLFAIPTFVRHLSIKVTLVCASLMPCTGKYKWPQCQYLHNYTVDDPSVFQLSQKLEELQKLDKSCPSIYLLLQLSYLWLAAWLPGLLLDVCPFSWSNFESSSRWWVHKLSSLHLKVVCSFSCWFLMKPPCVDMNGWIGSIIILVISSLLDIAHKERAQQSNMGEVKSEKLLLRFLFL